MNMEKTSMLLEKETLRRVNVFKNMIGSETQDDALNELLDRQSVPEVNVDAE